MCATLVFVAAVSVSFAAWIDRPVTDRIDNGSDSVNIGSFYVDAADGATVRQSQGSCAADNSFTYKNYVCVYKATDNVDYTYINFEIDLIAGDADTNVVSFEVSRIGTDKTGTPVGAATAMEVIDPPSKLSDFLPENFITGPYVKLDFAPDGGQYYALRVTLVTDGEVRFVFSATASDYDNHEWRVPNTYFLGFDGWKMNATSKMTGSSEKIGEETDESGVVRDIENVDYSIKLTLKADARFKMIKSDNNDGREIAVYYRPKNDALSLVSDCARVLSNGDVSVNVTGVFEIRYSGNANFSYLNVSNGTMEYRIDMIEVTLVREITDALTETNEAGSYIVGIFTDDKTVEEYKLTDDYSDIEGFKAFDWSDRADVRKGDRFKVVTINADGSKTETAQAVVSVTSKGEKKMLFDTYEKKAYGDDGIYRFIVDPNNIAASAVSIGYRRIINDLTTNTDRVPSSALSDANAALLGYQFEADLKSVPNAIGLYYTDILYDETLAGKTSNLGVSITGGVAGDIVSVTVHGATVNSYNINKYTGASDSFAGGYSYRITAQNVPQATGGALTEADCLNWTGTIKQGVDGDRTGFGLDNGGYVVLDADGSKISDLSRDDSSPSHPYVTSVKKSVSGSRKFVVFINGNAKALRNDDEIPRVVKAEHVPYAFATIDSDKALGTYFIGAGENLINISFLSQDVSGVEITEGALWQDGFAEGYYAVGQFSRWKAYPEYRLTRSETEGLIWEFEHDRIITSADVGDATGITAADSYKVVYVKNSNGKAAMSWYGKNASGDFAISGGNNIVASSTTVDFNAAAMFGSVAAPSAGECYAVGEFSGWKIYDYFKMPSGVFQLSDFHIQSGDKYKIYYNNAYRGLSQDVDNGNLTATSDTVHLDVCRMYEESKETLLKLGAEFFEPLADDVIRVTYISSKSNVKIWAWGQDPAGNDSDYFVGGWEKRPDMKKAGSSNIWYFDLTRRADFTYVVGMNFTADGVTTANKLVNSSEWCRYISFT